MEEIIWIAVLIFRHGRSMFSHNRMESFLSKLFLNQKRIWRFIIIVFCVLIVAYSVVPYIVAIFIRLGLITFPDIGDNDPQANPQPPDSLLGTILMAIWKIVLFPACVVEFFCAKTGINPRGIIQSFLYISPGLFWASLVELLFMTKKRLRPNKPQGIITSN
jgi:hypothetical protein